MLTDTARAGCSRVIVVYRPHVFARVPLTLFRALDVSNLMVEDYDLLRSGSLLEQNFDLWIIDFLHLSLIVEISHCGRVANELKSFCVQ